MAVNLSPIWGAGAQLLDNSGNVLSGGKIYTYAAGTTTQVTTYTSATGGTANSNPIVLNSAGRVPYEIWLTDGQNYKFVLKDSNDVLIGTWDNLSGINSNFIAYTNQQEIQTATAGQTVFNLTTMNYLPATNSLSVFVDGVNQYGPGASYAYEETDSNTVTFTSGLHDGAEVKFTSSQIQNAGVADASQITYDPPFTDSVATNVEAKLAQTVSVKDFGAVGDGVTDDSPAIQNAVDYLATQAECGLYFPSGTYLFNSQVSVILSNFCKYSIYGDGPDSVILGNNADGALKFTTAGTDRQTQMQVSDLVFKPLLDDSGTAFEYSVSPGGVSTRRMFVMQNVTCAADQTAASVTASWINTIIATGLLRPAFFNVVCFNNSTVKSNAILNIDGCYGPLMKDCYFNGAATYGVSNIRTGIDNEGFFMDRCTINGSDTGIYINQTGRHPDIKIYNTHINCYVKGVNIVGAKFIWLSQNLMYCSQTTLDEYIDYYLDACDSVYVIDNVYRSSGALNRRHLKVVNGCDQILVREYGLRATTNEIPFVFEADVSNATIYLPANVAVRDFTSYPSQLWESDDTNTFFTVYQDRELFAVEDSTATAPRYRIGKYQGTPSNGSNLGAVEFTAYTADKSAQVPYASMRANSVDVTDSAQTGSLSVFTYTGGSAVRQAYYADGVSYGSVSPHGAGTVTVQGNNTLAYAMGTQCGIYFGTGSPEGVVSANPGSLFLRTDGGAGTSLYVKQSGSGNTGWAGK